MWAVNNEATSFDAFTQICESMAHEISLREEDKAGSYIRPTTATTAGGSRGTAPAATGVSRVKREGFATSTLSLTERQTLMKEGRCFNCREPGYMTRECPKKKTASATITAAAAIELEDAGENSESGNGAA
jgi:hypothetical protein